MHTWSLGKKIHVTLLLSKIFDVFHWLPADKPLKGTWIQHHRMSLFFQCGCETSLHDTMWENDCIGRVLMPFTYPFGTSNENCLGNKWLIMFYMQNN